jgi:hypothetical protein
MSNDLLVNPIREAVDTEWGPEALAMCDVQWWVRFASDLNRCDLIMEWFEAVHEHVRDRAHFPSPAYSLLKPYSAQWVLQGYAFSIASIGEPTFFELARLLAGMFQMP